MSISDFTHLNAYLQTNWSWAASLAASMFAMTVAALGLLNQDRKDEIALWLMGAGTEDDWSRSFCSLFDALFGNRHLSLRCFVRSAVASLVAVVLIWILMGSAGTLALRARAELSLGNALAIALVVNVLADYVSLLETRYLLGRMHKLRTLWVQVIVLVFDIALSAGIIWLAIYAYLNSPLYAGQAESFAEVFGLFSVFSVFFYSTFLTSVWTWAYVLSTWILRLFSELRLADWFDVERRPVMMLGLVLAGTVFTGGMLAALPFQKDAEGLTSVDRFLCRQTAGPVCLDVASLASSAEAIWTILQTSCGADLMDSQQRYVCREWLARSYARDPETTAAVIDLSCSAGFLTSCGIANSLPGKEFDCSQGADTPKVVCETLSRIGPGQREPAIDVDIMRLKRGIDVGSQIRDMAAQFPLGGHARKVTK